MTSTHIRRINGTTVNKQNTLILFLAEKAISIQHLNDFFSKLMIHNYLQSNSETKTKKQQNCDWICIKNSFTLLMRQQMLHNQHHLPFSLKRQPKHELTCAGKWLRLIIPKSFDITKSCWHATRQRYSCYRTCRTSRVQRYLSCDVSIYISCCFSSFSLGCS